MNEHDLSATEKGNSDAPLDKQQQSSTQDSAYSATDSTQSIQAPSAASLVDGANDSVETAAESRPRTTDELADACELHFLAPAERSGVLGRLDHYDILATIGKGGMGVVLKAFDSRLERVVAIKVMAPHLAVNATARKRFVREAQAGAAVNHRNVVAIHAVEAEHRPPYLVMEFVAGQSLADTLRDKKPPDFREIVRLGIEIASGLAAAHERSLIHRDIKPANILIENNTERVKITDFGLARAASDARLTQSGVVTGTPKYMSPEQALGQSLDLRSDLFSLGGVLYFLCTSRAPFGAETTLAVLNQVVKDDPKPIRELNPAIPEWFCDVVTKLHAKDPAQRIQSAHEVAEILSARLATLPLDEVSSSVEKGIEPPPLSTGDGESGFATTSLLKHPPATIARRPPSPFRARLTVGVMVAFAIVSLLIAKYATSGGQSSGKTEQEQPNPVVNSPLPVSTASTCQPFSPAVLADRDAFRLPPLKRLRHGKPVDVSCILRGFSPDGKWLVTISDGEPIVRVWNVATGKVHKELPCPGDLTCGPVFSHNGAWLAVYGIDGVATLWDTRTFTRASSTEAQFFRFRSAAFDGDDKVLATGREDGVVQFWEVVTGRKVAEFSAGTAPVLGLHFLPGNKRLAVFTPDRLPEWNRELDIWYYHCLVRTLDIDAKSATFKQTLHQWLAPDTHFLLFAGVGEHLYFVKDRYKQAPLLSIADAGTGAIRDIKSMSGVVPVTAVLVPSRGLLVAYADKVARFWNLETAKMEWEVTLPSGEDHGSFALHPDGKIVAFGSDDLTRVHFFNVETGKEVLGAAIQSIEGKSK